MDFPRLSRQVMTWFIVDRQSRVWLDRKGEASDPSWLRVKDGGDCRCINSPPYFYCTQVIPTVCVMSTCNL